MSGQLNLTQFFGGAPQIPAEGESADPAIDFSIPSAYEDPDLHDSVVITLASDDSVRFELPPAGMGYAEIVVSPAVKLDAKGGAGKAKPKTTKTGGEAMKEKITIHFIEQAWPFILAAARQMLPGSGPWNISHPSADIVGLTQIGIEKWTNAPRCKAEDGFMGEWEFHYSEIKASAQSGSGGGSATETPDAENNQRTIGPVKNPQSVDPNQKFQPAQEQAKKP